MFAPLPWDPTALEVAPAYNSCSGLWKALCAKKHV